LNRYDRTSSADAPQNRLTYRLLQRAASSKTCAPVCAETNAIKRDGVAARQLHSLRNYGVGELRLTDQIEIFRQTRDSA
jgi:hypothetical protein